MRKILLHTCCAPCATYPNQWLKENGFNVTGYFYNPNIKPEAEYHERLAAMCAYADQTGFRFIFEPNNNAAHESGHCVNCYELRLVKTAAKAKELGYDCFSTTLLISPYQNHERIRKKGTEIGEQYGLEFFYHDFRIGYRQSRQMSRELQLYRQKYCGCGIKNGQIAQAFTAK